MPSTTNLTYDSRGSAVVARITTPTISEREYAGLLHDLSGLARSHGGRAGADLSEVVMVTLAGLGMFIGVRKACAELNGKVLIVNANSDIHTLLTITKLQKLFPAAANVDAAASFR